MHENEIGTLIVDSAGGWHAMTLGMAWGECEMAAMKLLRLFDHCQFHSHCFSVNQLPST